MQARSNVLAGGDTLGGFRIISKLGQGGMGVVYLADDEHLERKVALKVIAPSLADNAEFKSRFEAEARHAAAIDHPNAASIYSAGSADGHYFIAMRYVEGSDLRQALLESGPLDVAAAVKVLSEVAAALDAAHAAGLVHRDVKPSNILVAGVPGEGPSYLTDFGLTRSLNNPSAQITMTGQWIGTLDYVAPEQMAGGRVDARADIYALGCVFYEMLTGEIPFPGDEMRKLWSKANEETPPLPSAGRPHPLDAVIRRATARDPDRRFRSAGDLARAAAAATGGGEGPTERSVATGPATVVLAPPPVRMPTVEPMPVRPGAGQPPTHPAPQHRARGRSAAIVLGSVAIAVGFVAAALLLTQGGSESGVNTSAHGPRKRPGQVASSSSEPSTTPSSAVGKKFVGARYSLRVPADWVQVEVEKTASDGSYIENKWRSPNGQEEILIDDSPGNPADPAASAATIAAGVSNAGETVYSVTNDLVRGGVTGSELDFRADSGLPERADFFFDLGGSGFAVLASGYDLATAQRRLGPVVFSLDPVG